MTVSMPGAGSASADPSLVNAADVAELAALAAESTVLSERPGDSSGMPALAADASVTGTQSLAKAVPGFVPTVRTLSDLPTSGLTPSQEKFYADKLGAKGGENLISTAYKANVDAGLKAYEDAHGGQPPSFADAKGIENAAWEKTVQDPSSPAGHYFARMDEQGKKNEARQEGSTLEALAAQQSTARAIQQEVAKSVAAA